MSLTKKKSEGYLETELAVISKSKLLLIHIGKPKSKLYNYICKSLYKRTRV